MSTTLIVVQHAEKQRAPGDPGLTDLGREQARAAAHELARRSTSVVISSPMWRALETARLLATRLGSDVTVEPRLRERMNWDDPDDQTIEEFLAEWARASADRDYVPRSGDSSRATGARFLDALADVADGFPGLTVAVVTHGGATTDALRTLLGDNRLHDRAPSLIEDGVPSCGLTTLVREGAGWDVSQIASTGHLDARSRHRPA